MYSDLVPYEERRPVKHPRLITPLAVRLSGFSLTLLLVGYLVVSTALTAFLAGLLVLASDDLGYERAFFRTLSALWASGQLLDDDGQSLAYYLVASVATITGLALPLFFLSAYIFKLFRHEPIQWRATPALTDFRDEGPSLSFKFYNRTSSMLAGITVTVSSRVIADGDAPVWANKRMKMITGSGEEVMEARFAVMEPGLPTMVRVLLHGSMDAEAIAKGDRIPVPGYEARTQQKALVEFIVTVTGVSVNTGDTFVSVRKYHAGALTETGDAQDIAVKPTVAVKKWPGWDNFDGLEPLYVFGYGSLVNVESLSHTLEYVPPPRRGPFVVRLQGWQRRWNVGYETETRSDRAYFDEDGVMWEGMIISLGLAPAPDELTPGVVFEVSSRDLWRLDLRESNYYRLDVTAKIVWAGRTRPGRVFTYIPHEEAKERARHASLLPHVNREPGWRPGVITKRYLELVEEGYEALIPQDPSIRDEHLSTYPSTSPFEIKQIIFQATPSHGPGGEPGEPSVTPPEEMDS